jgi:glycosyltransferase involved in cell wall biosynthesis
MISFIINTYNRSTLLTENLQNMKVLGKKVEMVIVDDCSNDNTFSEVKDFIEKNPDLRIKYIRNKINQGYAKSMNIGIQSSLNDFVFILNDDVFLVDPVNFVGYMEEDLKKASIVATRLNMENPFSFGHIVRSFFYSIPATFAGEIYNYNNRKRRYVKFGNNGLGFNKRELRILFDDKNFAGNFFRIESDFQARARFLGFKILYDPRLLILDKWHSTGGLRQESRKKFLYWCIFNHLIFLRKNSGWTKYYKILFYFLLKSISHPFKIRVILSAFSDAFEVKIKR